MPRVQTTGVDVVIKARSASAKTELRTLKREVSDFGAFTRETFKSLSSARIPAPRLAPEWRQLERELGDISRRIKKHVDSITALQNRTIPAPALPRNFPRNPTAPGAAPTGAGTGAGRGRNTDFDEASRLTREWKAGTLSLEEYRAKLDDVARTSAASSERQLDALTRLRGAEKLLAADAQKRAGEQKRAADEAAKAANIAARPPSRNQEISDAARLTREWRAGTLSAEQYDAKLKEIAKTAAVGSERQLDALQRVNAAQRAAATSAETLAGRQRAQQARRYEAVQTGAGIATRAGDTLTGAVTLPIVAGLTAAAKSAIDYEAAMRNVSSITTLSEEQFNGLYKSVIQIAKDPQVKEGPTELAKALYELQSSGFDVKKSLDDPKSALAALSVASKGASAGLTDTNTASSALIAVLNSGIGGVSNAKEAMNALFQTVNDGKVSFAELSGSIGAILPTATKAGLTIQEVGGAIAALTIQGQSGAEATNDLLNLITKIANPSETAEKQFRKLGISFGFNGLQARGLPAILQEISKATQGNADKIKRLLPDMQAQRAALGLLKNDVRDYNKFIVQQGQANQGVGATNRALAEQTKSMQFQLAQLKKEFQIMAAEAGPGLIRALRDVLQAGKPLIQMAKNLAEQFSRLSPEQQKTVLKLILLAASVGPVLSGFGRMASSVNEMTRFLQLMQGASASTASTLAGETVQGIEAVGTAAGKAGGKVDALTTLLSGLGKLGRIAITITLALVGAELVGQALQKLDVMTKGGVSKGLGYTLGGPMLGEQISNYLYRDGKGIAPLSETVGEAYGAGAEWLDAWQKNGASENAPGYKAARAVQQGRADRKTAFANAARFNNLIPKAGTKGGGGNLSYAERQSVLDEFARRGATLPRDSEGFVNFRDALTQAARFANEDAEKARGRIEGGKTSLQQLAQGTRRDSAEDEAGLKRGQLGNLSPVRGLSLSDMGSRSRNLLRALGATGAEGNITGFTRDKQGRAVITLSGNTEGLGAGLVQYGMNRVTKGGESAKTVADTVKVANNGKTITVTIVDNEKTIGAGAGTAGRVTGGPPIQPGARDTGRGSGNRARKTVVAGTDAINAGATVAELNDQYNTAFGRYSDRGDNMSEADRKKAEQGLMALANRIRAAEEMEAGARLRQATTATEAARKEADRLKAAATNQNEIDRANDMIAEANKTEAEATARNAGEMAQIRRDHSNRYRQITKTQEDVQKQVAEQDARDAEQNKELEAQKHEQRVAAIDEELKNTQDAAKRAELLNEKFNEMRDAATARYDAAKEGAKTQEPRERARSLAAAYAEYNAAVNPDTGSIARERKAAGLENDQFRLESEIKLHEVQAENLDDLIAKHRLLKQIEDERINLLKMQNATPEQVKAQQEANARADAAREAGIARDNTGRLLVKASTEGVGSFAGTGWEGLANQNEAGAAQFRAQLATLFKAEYDNTDAPNRGKVGAEQFDTLKQAVEVGVVTMNEVLPLLRDIETRINSSGDFGASQAFYKNFRDFFEEQMAPQFRDADRKKGPGRERAYNELIAGVNTDERFAGLSPKERDTIVKAIEGKRDRKDDTDKQKYHEGLTRIGDEAIRSVQQAADARGGDIVAAIFGDRERGKKAAEGFWQEVTETGRKSVARVADELLLKPIGRRITAGLEGVFRDGANHLTQSLDKSLQGFGGVFKSGVGGILQAAAYLQGVLALSGQQGRRGKKGGILGAVAGVGLGLATGGTGLALLGAGLTGAGAGSQFANGNVLGGLLSVGTGFIGGGSFGAGAFGTGAKASGGVSGGAVLPGGGNGIRVPTNPGGAAGLVGGSIPIPKASGGMVGAGRAYLVNEELNTRGGELFVPNTDGMIIPSATAINRLPTVAAANNRLLEQLTQLAANGGPGGSGGHTFNLNNYGPTYTEVDGQRTLRTLAREVRDQMNRR